MSDLDCRHCNEDSLMPEAFRCPDCEIAALRARVAELERENKILTTQRDEYRECCSTLDTQGTKGVVEGWVCVPECEWAQAFRPLNLF